MAMAKHVKDHAEFDRELKAAGARLVLVDFYADWCGPCKAIAPLVDQLAGRFKDKAVVLKVAGRCDFHWPLVPLATVPDSGRLTGQVNADDSDGLAAEYGVRALPTFVFFHKGKKVEEVVGGARAVARRGCVSAQM